MIFLYGLYSYCIYQAVTEHRLMYRSNHLDLSVLGRHPIEKHLLYQTMNFPESLTDRDTATNGQATLNASILSSGYTDGHSIDAETVDGPAGSNGSTPSGKYTNGHSINGEVVNGFECHGQSPIAICGMALRLPAGLKTPQQLWEFLLAGGDARGRVPSSRYNVAAFHDSTGKHGTVITEYGYFLNEDIGALDTSFFSMPRMEVERTDPQQRLMLQTARECFEDAGEIAWRGKRIGCFMGSLGEDWCEMFARETQNWGPYRYTGFGDFALSNRVSYEMDLQGPRCVTLVI